MVSTEEMRLHNIAHCGIIKKDHHRQSLGIGVITCKTAGWKTQHMLGVGGTGVGGQTCHVGARTTKHMASAVHRDL